MNKVCLVGRMCADVELRSTNTGKSVCGFALAVDRKGKDAIALDLVKEGGAFLSMKSVESEDEINAAKKAISTLGGKIEKCVDYTTYCLGTT